MATSPGRLNPYKLGIELFRDIEERWNRVVLGRNSTSATTWPPKEPGIATRGLGRQKIFEVRRIHNDLTFIDDFLTLDFCRQHKLFSFGYNDEADYYEIESREFPKIKQQLLFSLTNRRPAADRRPRRQLQESRRVVSGTPVQRRRAARLAYARDTLRSTRASVDPPRAHRDRARGATDGALVRRTRTFKATNQSGNGKILGSWQCLPGSGCQLDTFHDTA